MNLCVATLLYQRSSVTRSRQHCERIRARWRLKSPASRLFTQPFIQAQVKENIKAPHHWPL